jgi:hypothetical protein
MYQLPLRTLSPFLGAMYSPHDVAVGLVVESITDTQRGIQTVFADGYREADASIRLRHSVANSHKRRKGSQVTPRAGVPSDHRPNNRTQRIR